MDDHPQSSPADPQRRVPIASVAPIAPVAPVLPDPGSPCDDDGATLSLRTAVPDDAAALFELSLRAIRGSASAHYTAAQLEAWVARRSVAGHRRLIEDTQTFVAARGAVVEGFACLVVEPGLADAVVDQLFVDPGAGGRGVARLLLTAVEHAAREVGATRLVTHASWRAEPVFERLGYRRVEVETVLVGDQTLTRALMHRDLATR